MASSKKETVEFDSDDEILLLEPGVIPDLNVAEPEGTAMRGSTFSPAPAPGSTSSSTTPVRSTPRSFI